MVIEVNSAAVCSVNVKMLTPTVSAVVLLLLATMGTAQRVRLRGGSRHEGRLEVYHNSIWGTVCDDGFTSAAARVVCYMLGYGRAGTFIGNRYGAGSGQIWLDEVRCSGMETSIAGCQHNRWGRHDCSHSEDVSVSCIAVTVRLVGGNSPAEGRLEVNYSGTWGTVCDDSFSNSSAAVVCYMLGFGHSGEVISNRYGAGSGQIWLDDVRCSGTEIRIENCQHRRWGHHNCGHYQDVSISCFNEVRLVVDSGSKGRFEVYHNSTWGTVCNVGFTDAAAGVVCYSLGFGHSGRFIGNQFGAGSGQIWLDNVLATARNHTSRTVSTTAGAVTAVDTLTMFPSHVSPTRLKQSRWLEEEIHGLDVLNCFTALSGEPFVMMDSLTQLLESFATLLDSDMSDERWTLTYTVWVTD